METAIIAGIASIIGGLMAFFAPLALQKAKHRDETEDKRDEWKAHVDACLSSDKKRLDNIETGDKLILRALMAVLGHMEDGNHTGELGERRRDIEQYLIER